MTGGDIKLKATADTQILQSLSFLSLCPTETGVTGGDIKLKATADTQYLQSPSFPEFVPSSLRETWIITAGLRQVISLQVNTQFFLSTSISQCSVFGERC